MEKLGNELSHRDEIAARAEDMVLEKYPDAKSVLHGWITELRTDGDTVYLVMEKDAGLALTYSVTFPPITVLSFIYTRCAASKACPYVTGVLGQPHCICFPFFPSSFDGLSMS